MKGILTDESIMRKLLWLISLFLLLLSSTLFAAGKAILLDLSGPIGPAAQDYIQRSIEDASKKNAKIIILQINTPGGLETSMREINAAILTSKVPVIAYVAPSGARAASAGVFIMYASHLNAMASGTNIGAASPVSLMGEQKDSNSKKVSTMEKKAINDASAYIRSLAELRGRNVNWAESAVRTAESISATEAKKLNVIDEIADNYQQLLDKMDGRKVTINNKTQTVDTKNLQIEPVARDWRYKFLSFITDPNIAYILMLVAIYGLFFELSNPGLVLPGVAGIIALLLVLYAFQLMPINYVGLSLILIGVAFMIFEVYIPSFGALGIGGLIAFILGSIMLFDINNSAYRLNWGIIIGMSLVTAALFFLIANLALRSYKKAVVTGQEGLIGSEGVVLSIMNRQIVVRVMGEIWEAKCPQPLEQGQRVKVKKIEGLTLTVEPIKNHTNEKSGA